VTRAANRGHDAVEVVFEMRPHDAVVQRLTGPRPPGTAWARLDRSGINLPLGPMRIIRVDTPIMRHGVPAPLHRCVTGVRVGVDVMSSSRGGAGRSAIPLRVHGSLARLRTQGTPENPHDWPTVH
jgi:hypothetical protein